jgi:hypothetical protein
MTRIQSPCIGIDINGIIETSRKGIRVRTPDGRGIWLPADHVTVLRGRVLLPLWLARKVQGHGKH